MQRSSPQSRRCRPVRDSRQYRRTSPRQPQGRSSRSAALAGARRSSFSILQSHRWFICGTTVFCLVESSDTEAIRASIHDMVKRSSGLCAGLSPQAGRSVRAGIGLSAAQPASIPPVQPSSSRLKVPVTIFPTYAGNLDIMNIGGVATAERLASQMTMEQSGMKPPHLHSGRHATRRHARHPSSIHARAGQEHCQRPPDAAKVDAIGRSPTATD